MSMRCDQRRILMRAQASTCSGSRDERASQQPFPNCGTSPAEHFWPLIDFRARRIDSVIASESLLFLVWDLLFLRITSETVIFPAQKIILAAIERAGSCRVPIIPMLRVGERRTSEN